MQELTQAQFLNALDGKSICILWHNRTSSRSKSLIEQTLNLWRTNLDTLDDDVFIFPCETATKLNDHSFRIGNYHSTVISTHGYRCYKAVSGHYYMLRMSSYYLGGLPQYALEAYLFAA